MIRTIAITSLVLALSGCGVVKSITGPSKRVAFDGVQFRASVKRSEESRAHFNVVVQKAAQSITGAREAGRYQATRYCIAQYGTSKIDWISGPDAEDGALRMSDDGALLLEGVCTP